MLLNVCQRDLSGCRRLNLTGKLLPFVGQVPENGADIEVEDLLFGNRDVACAIFVSRVERCQELCRRGAAEDPELWEDILERPVIPGQVYRQPYEALPLGSWSTPLADRALVAPGTRIQRRTPSRCFQVHVAGPERTYSKIFTWAASGPPTMETMLAEAVDWSWQQWRGQ